MGNAINFFLTSMLVRHKGGKLLLRIDDMDETRCRREFVDDVFYLLEWLGIEIDEGPSGTEEFYSKYSMSLKRDYYRNELAKLSQTKVLLYACECSRKVIEAVSKDSRYPQICKTRELALQSNKTAMRVHVPDNTVISVEKKEVILDEVLGDFVLWRKDGLPAYQFVSVIEDRDMKVNFIVRGEDLLESTAAQLFLAPYLKAETFTHARILHHPLLYGNDGKKLSKSEGAYSVRSMRHEMGEKGKGFIMNEAQKLFDQMTRKP